jgi:branched-chain amino acid transport system ATP-binding protein
VIGIRRRFLDAAGEAPVLPLALLFVLNLVDEFDQVAFGVLAPEIADHFTIAESSFIALATLAAGLVIMLIVPVAVVADRYSRVRMTAGAALAWSTMSVLTGLAPVLAILVIARFGSGLGRVMNEPVHASLLADYYPPVQHGKVFSVHRMANPIGLMLVLVAGLLGDTFGWRATFVLLALPTIPAIFLVRRLEEPVRGASLDLGLAVEAERQAERVPFGEAYRRLKAVPTLRRVWVGAFILGAGIVPVATFFSFFYDNVYNLGPGPVGRAGVLALFGAGTFIGLTLGSRYSTATIMRGEPDGLARGAGIGITVFGLGTIVVALGPWIGLALAATFLGGIGAGSINSFYLPLVATVAPPRIRSQAYGWTGFWFALGAIILAGPIGRVGETQGYRTAFFFLAVLMTISGLVYRSAGAFTRKDAENAYETLRTEARLRDARAEVEQALLVCRGVEVAYDGVQVLFGVDFEVTEGEIVALLGTNGAGKSTLLRAISGLTPPIRGSVFFDGQDVTHTDPQTSAALGIIQMPGGRAIFPTLTVEESMRVAGWLWRKQEPASVQQAVEEALGWFPVLRERWGTAAGDLSGGEQQMLGLAMAFVGRPRLLMIDELSLGLAPTIVEQLVAIVREIHDRGATIVIVEQSVNTALLLAERAIFMEKGQVKFSGPTADLLDRGDILRSVFLERAGGPATKKGSRRSGPPPEGETVLGLDAVVKRFGGIRAVDEVSLDLREGEILGLIGPNGAGKTTIMDLVSGHLPIDGGSVHLRVAGLDGLGHLTDVTDWAPDHRARSGLGRSFQDARLFSSLTVAECIAVGLERHLRVRDPLAAALGMPEVRESEDEAAWAVHELVELMGLGDFRNKFVGELSTGSRRIVDLSLAVAHHPRVLLLDEPSSGIAQRETEALGPLLERIQHETGCSMLVIEHDVPLISELADRMIALDLGRVIAEGTPAQVIRHPEVVASYLGTDEAVVARSGKRAPRRRQVAAKARSTPKAPRSPRTGKR